MKRLQYTLAGCVLMIVIAICAKTENERKEDNGQRRLGNPTSHAPFDSSPTKPPVSDTVDEYGEPAVPEDTPTLATTSFRTFSPTRAWTLSPTIVRPALVADQATLSPTINPTEIAPNLTEEPTASPTKKGDTWLTEVIRDYFTTRADDINTAPAPSPALDTTISPTLIPTLPPSLVPISTPPTPSPTLAPTISPTLMSTPILTLSPTWIPRRTVSIIFVSDLETEYRSTTEHGRRVVEYIKNIESQNFVYANGDKVVADLVIHGGDVSDLEDVWKMNDPVNYLFDNVWGQLYDAEIPFISILGNHDASCDDGASRCKPTPEGNRFCNNSFRKANMVDPNFEFSEYTPQENGHMSYYIAKFNGVQIATINYQLFNLDDQWESFKNGLDMTMPTIFVSHRSISMQKQGAKLKELINMFPPGTAHFAGHTHIEKHLPRFHDRNFDEHIAPYPFKWHTWDDTQKPGFFSILIGEQGVIEVKTIYYDIKEVSGCKWKGDIIFWSGLNKWDAMECCQSMDYEYWDQKAAFACGKEPCWGDGEHCAAGTTCNSCCNNYEYWGSLAFTACGSEPSCWKDGTLCGIGTTCNKCCNSWSWEYFWTVCGP